MADQVSADRKLYWLAGAGLVALLLTPLLMVGTVGVIFIALLDSGEDAGAAGVSSCSPVDSITPVTDAQVEGFTSEQLGNAAEIVQAGADLGVSVHGQTVAVMTAIGESSLINIDYGDWETAGWRNPDGTPTSSLGLFQQQRWWGSVEERMDPHTAATLFYRALLQVPGWESMQPTLAANATQNNADPYHYRPYWAGAVAIVTALSGNPDLVLPGADAPCALPAASIAGTGDWVHPLGGEGRLTSGFGMRTIFGRTALHTGQDLAQSCGSPVFAAAAGTVIFAGFGPYQGRTGNIVVLDHGGGVQTWYGHLLTGTMAVRVGDVVTSGQQIASSGGDKNIDPVGAGNSTGCHLHFEVHDPDAVDPLPWMLEHGVQL